MRQTSYKFWADCSLYRFAPETKYGCWPFTGSCDGSNPTPAQWVGSDSKPDKAVHTKDTIRFYQPFAIDCSWLERCFVLDRAQYLVQVCCHISLSHIAAIHFVSL